MAASSAAALLSSFLVVFLLCSSTSSANEANILVSGQVLSTDEQLSVENAVFVIQNDCNLVLYNKGKGFQSNTSGSSTKCILTLSDYGQLIITDVITKKVVWSSPRAKGDSKGQYAAILQPDGEVGIYGPAVWSTPSLASKEVNVAGVENKISGDAPSSSANLLFSSEVLKEGWKVVSRDYALEVTKECGLQLTKSGNGNTTVVWKGPRFPANEYCFARLNFHGQLALLEENCEVLWSSRAGAEKGVYVLAVKIDGQATIYGPRFWSTAAY